MTGEGGFDKAVEEGMRFHRLRFEFGMILHGDEPWVRRDFDDLDEVAAGADAGGDESRFGEGPAVLRVEFVAVAMPLDDVRRAVAAGGDRLELRPARAVRTAALSPVGGLRRRRELARGRNRRRMG